MSLCCLSLRRLGDVLTTADAVLEHRPKKQKAPQSRPTGRAISVIENHSIEAQSKRPTRRMGPAMSILWTIIIGFVAGLIAKFLHPGNKNEPSGFILTTLLGIAGAFVATYLGQALGWYKAGEGAGFIGAIVGAIIVLVVWGIFANRRGQGV